MVLVICHKTGILEIGPTWRSREFCYHMNKQRSLGGLADLAKILEEASNPESSLRESRKENKPKLPLARKGSGAKRTRVIDSKRKLWYEKRLKEKIEQPKEVVNIGASVAPINRMPSLTRSAATKLGSNLLESLASAKEAKPKDSTTKGRVESWRRKPGDPIF